MTSTKETPEVKEVESTVEVKEVETTKTLLDQIIEFRNACTGYTVLVSKQGESNVYDYKLDPTINSVYRSTKDAKKEYKDLESLFADKDNVVLKDFEKVEVVNDPKQKLSALIAGEYKTNLTATDIQIIEEFLKIAKKLVPVIVEPVVVKSAEEQKKEELRTKKISTKKTFDNPKTTPENKLIAALAYEKAFNELAGLVRPNKGVAAVFDKNIKEYLEHPTKPEAAKPVEEQTEIEETK